MSRVERWRRSAIGGVGVIVAGELGWRELGAEEGPADVRQRELGDEVGLSKEDTRRGWGMCSAAGRTATAQRLRCGDDDVDIRTGDSVTWPFSHDTLPRGNVHACPRIYLPRESARVSHVCTLWPVTRGSIHPSHAASSAASRPAKHSAGQRSSRIRPSFFLSLHHRLLCTSLHLPSRPSRPPRP